ncbi:hypothetical protein ZYGR_0AD00790 [Zygosaccharomyces rouxii]|uniref:Glycerol uptake/efflux facilitator protein n=1 Tax=Zygosaccharomyces rouxii TaxID=4956 RepID=A0A1Q3A584_ZYGRO|nr:hypothetical protein ZYGR_0AD00790 [Zygosaccharomyces rouxii]
MPDTQDGKSNSQKLLNDYLSNPDPGPSPSAPQPRTAGTGDTSTTAADVNLQGNKNFDNSGNSGIESRHKSSSNWNDDGYDYEMQNYYPQPYTQRTSRARSNTNYIPHYMTGPDSQYPIQEVVPNTQMAVATGSDPAANRADGFGHSVRSRAPTIRSNVPDFHSILGSTRSKPHSHNGSHIRSNSSGRSSAASAAADSENHGNETGDGVNSGSSNHALSTPLMVRPKTLHQNPQTPTVLPSAYHPINNWTSLKHGYLKEFLAEFVGTMVMIIFGNAVNCQVNVASKIQQENFDKALQKVSNSPEQLRETAEAFKNLVSSTSGGTFDEVALGWAAATTMGYFAAGGSAISGGHLNPSITVVNFIFRGFPFKNVFIYVTGQLLGAFVGALILFIFYKRVIEEGFPGEWWKNETVAGIFCVFPKPYLSTSRQFVSEYICTALLQIGTFALTDPYTSLSSDLFPLMLFILMYILNASLSYQTGSAMNMARDLGPRLALYAVGFNRHMLWVNHHHFFWVPIVAPFLGSITGGLIYDVCIYQGHESPVNWPIATYKDILRRSWLRRRQWKGRSNWPVIGKKLSNNPAPSEFSDFSYEDDDEDRGNPFQNPKTDPSKVSLVQEADPGADTRSPDSVHFKSVQGDSRRLHGEIPTIMEENPSLETESLGSLTSLSINNNDNNGPTSNDGIPSFPTVQKKQE